MIILLEVNSYVSVYNTKMELMGIYPNVYKIEVVDNSTKIHYNKDRIKIVSNNLTYKINCE